MAYHPEKSPEKSLFWSGKQHHSLDVDVLDIDTSIPPPPPSFAGIPLKYISLVTLAVQNAALAVLMHYSRVSASPSHAYSAASAVLATELLKGGISLLIAFSRVELVPQYTLLEPPTSFSRSVLNPRLFLTRCRLLGKEVFRADCWKLSIPAILYVIQNNLQFVAASNLDAATFQVSYQMKILTTAAFSVLLLRKKLTPLKWLALFFLAVGVAVVQLQTAPHKPSLSPDVHTMFPMTGFLAVAAACFTSGLAGVYFEMVLKNSTGDLWVRNVQLSLFSLLPALVPIVFSPQHPSATPVPSLTHLFANFTPAAWATVATQVLGGLITALVIKYADNIMKGFATSLSIVISFLFSVALFHVRITAAFVIGASIVLAATWLYSQPDGKRVVLQVCNPHIIPQRPPLPPSVPYRSRSCLH
ncbi:nucleotide-sugar transporter-domain-containing protein [Amylostereum chailletii]|nr:nucleotide-sugar transporter-domain-containing protein [Amylostereum chailletii]